MRRPPVRAGRTCVCLALASVLSPSGRVAAQQAPQDVVLAREQTIERQLGGGASFTGLLHLEAGQFARIIVDQRGVDVTVALRAPGGETLVEVDGPNDKVGPEPVMVVAVVTGDYRLDVQSAAGTAPGNVEVRVVEVRAVNPQDQDRIAAERAVMAARAQRDQRTAASQREAVERYHEAIALWRKSDEAWSEAFAQHAMGLVLGDIGEFQNALDAYARAHALYARVGDDLGQASVLSNSGWVYGELGEYQKAIDVYERLLGSQRAAGARIDELRLLNNIAAAYGDLGKYDRALEIHTQVLALRRAANDRAGQAITLNNMAYCNDRLGDKAAALEYYRQALALMPEVGNVFYTATTLNHLGVLYRDMGRPEDALSYFDQALAYRRTIGDSNGEAATLYELARLERDRGNLDEARQQIEAALSTVESLRAKLASQQLRASYFATARTYHEFHVDLLMQLHARHPDAGFDALAMQASERARARSLLELLAEARTDLRRRGDSTLFERERTLRERISERADRQTRLLSGQHTDEQAAAAAAELDTLTAEYEQVATDIRRSDPRYAALTEPEPSGPSDVQGAVLDKDSVLVEYALGDDRSYVWAVTPAAVHSAQLPGREVIASAARRVYDLVTARGQQVPNETPARRQRRVERADAEYPAAAAELGRILLGPVAQYLRARRLLIAVEGVLQYVPFAALVAPDSDSTRPLILDHEVVVLPSSSVATALRSESSGRERADRSLMVFADPVFSRDDPRVSLSATRGALSDTQAAADDARRSAEESGITELVRLRFSRTEADAIARLADDGTTRKAVDFAASRTVAMEGDLDRYRVVHFATHALVNNRHPELSGVVLSLVDEQGRDQNGFLRLYDIYNLRLKADLVVLSACETALGKDVTGEGLIGLTRGFMYAGAPRVVATLWRIDDRATAELMARFYKEMLTGGLRPAAALTAAQASMWKEARWRSPYYWAAFTFQGDWQ